MCCLLEGGEIFGCSSIAEGDADVAQEARAFGSFDGRLAEEAAELEIGEGEEVTKSVFEDCFAGMELRFLRDFREAVPRADAEAVVTPVDAVAHHRPQFERDGAFVFDGEVGDATTCIH